MTILQLGNGRDFICLVNTFGLMEQKPSYDASTLTVKFHLQMLKNFYELTVWFAERGGFLVQVPLDLSLNNCQLIDYIGLI